MEAAAIQVNCVQRAAADDDASDSGTCRHRELQDKVFKPSTVPDASGASVMR